MTSYVKPAGNDLNAKPLKSDLTASKSDPSAKPVKKGIIITVSMASLTSALLIILLVVVLFNQYSIVSINNKMSGYAVAGLAGSANNNQEIALKISDEIVPKEGTKTGYGLTFAVSTIDTLVGYQQTIQLNPDQAQRYVRIGTAKGTACEACCGIGERGALQENGELACGCAHNIAIAGLIKHMVVNYPEYDDQAIYEEIQDWKAFFFPKFMVEKEMSLRGISTQGTALATQVGGC